MTNVAEKSILAKLLATENISVEHKKVQTAYFDLATRTVVLPIWKNMSPDLYDLLIGHEVGHALNTPKEGWHDSVSERGSGFKGFLNIIEDARIERMQKEKYPGLRRSFFNGYKELFDKDFFGVKGMDVNKLKFIDRINLYAKIGSFLNIKFSADEQAFVNRLDTLNTWDDVVALATELYERADTTQEESQWEDFMDAMQSLAEEMEMDGLDMPSDAPVGEQTEPQEDAQAEPGSSNEKSDLAEEAAADETAESSDAESDNTENQDKDSADTDSTPGSGGEFQEDQEPSEPSSYTDQKFRESEDSLLDDNARENTYVRLGKLNPADFILGVDYFHNNVKIESQTSRYYPFYNNDPVEDINAFPAKVYAEFLAKNNKYLNAMVQDFDRKKQAKQFARARSSKTGRINMDKIWAYKLTEDVFLQQTVVPNGQNHGILMFLDMSGSMRSNIQGTMEQLVLLASFCQKVRIPFEVYGFTSNHYCPQEYTELDALYGRNDRTDTKNLQIDNSYFRILQLVSTNVSSTKFKIQMRNLLVYGQAAGMGGSVCLTNETSAKIGLSSSTPLEESIMVARYLAEEFRTKYRVEVLSTVFLTDGDGDGHFSPMDNNIRVGRNNMAITDAKTNLTVIQPSTGQFDRYGSGNRRMFATALLKLYKQTTGSRVINFFVADRRQAAYYIDDLCYGTKEIDWETRNKVRKEFKEGTAVLSGVSGFDQQFILKGGSLNTEDDILEVEDGAAKGQILKAFKKMQVKKGTSRSVLTKMIEAVA
jgi:hypothetical protein